MVSGTRVVWSGQLLPAPSSRYPIRSIVVALPWTEKTPFNKSRECLILFYTNKITFIC